MWTQIRLLLKEQSDLGPQCLPLCLCEIDIFRCSYFAGVLRTKSCYVFYTEVMELDDTVMNTSE